MNISTETKRLAQTGGEPTKYGRADKEGSMNGTLIRSTSDRMIGGVCGGLAAYFGIDSALVRLIFVLAVLSGVSPLVYLVLWIVMPEASTSAPAAAQTLIEHPRPAEQWKYDPYTGEKIER